MIIIVEALVKPPKPSEERTGNVVKEIPPTEDKEGKAIELSCVSSVKVSVPVIDCREEPKKDVVAANVEEEPLLMIETSPSIWVMPPRLTVAIVDEITTSPCTFVHPVSVLRSDCEAMLNVAEVHAGFADVVLV